MFRNAKPDWVVQCELGVIESEQFIYINKDFLISGRYIEFDWLSNSSELL